jgi:predicted secreted hydrolase
MVFPRGLGVPPSLAGQSSAPPQLISADKSAIFLPADQYMHRGVPTEWWWHVGTLRAGERVFGFEINAAAFSDRGYAFSQIMLTDLANRRQYQASTTYWPPVAVDFANWAEHDPTRDWHVGLGSVSNRLSAIKVTNPGSGYSAEKPPAVTISGGGGSQAQAYAVVGESGQIASLVVTNPGRGYTSVPQVSISGSGGAAAEAYHSYVTMDAAWGDPTQSMAVTALLNDEATGTQIYFDLTMSQKGAPFLVWGTGVRPLLPPGSGTHLQTNNYYYSLPRLDAQGSISIVPKGASSIAHETLQVAGTTWMDHQYGLFGSATHPVTWILQDAQLNNGWVLSNFALGPKYSVGTPTVSWVTLQDPEGAIYAGPSLLTPTGATWTSPQSGQTYFMEFQIEIFDFADPLQPITLTVKSLLDGQEFPNGPGGISVYEGIAVATGTFRGAPVSGTAWNEQHLVAHPNLNSASAL